MANLDRTKNSQYFGLDSTTISDKTIKTAQSGGIGVGAKIKALNTADPANGVEAYVVDAFDIDWTGYKVNGKAIKQTGELLEEIAAASGGLSVDEVKALINEKIGDISTGNITGATVKECLVKISTEITNLETHIDDKISENVGDLNTLTTSNKTNVVSAINELKSTGGKTYTADTSNNSITVGTIQYTLEVNNTTNKISLSSYTPLGVTLTANKTYEYGDTTTSRTVTATITGTRASSATITWDNNTSTNSKTCTQSFASPTSNTLKCTVSDGKSTADASTTVSFAPRVMWCYSTNDNLASIDNTSLTGYGSSIQSGVAVTNKSITIPEGTAAYIYFACAGTPTQFFINKGTTQATLSGGFTKTDYTFTKYTGSAQKTYNLYRTTNKQASGKYRIDTK